MSCAVRRMVRSVEGRRWEKSQQSKREYECCGAQRPVSNRPGSVFQPLLTRAPDQRFVPDFVFVAGARASLILLVLWERSVVGGKDGKINPRFNPSFLSPTRFLRPLPMSRGSYTRTCKHVMIRHKTDVPRCL